MRRLAILALALTACGQAETEPVDVDPEPRGEARRADEFRSSRVEEAVEAASEVVQTRGFATMDDAWRGFLVEHSVEVRERPMRSGTCYVALAAGSSAVRELNVRVYDSDGGEVVQDATDGPRAALRFCPSQSGTYYLTVRATAGSGLVEVRTFRGPTGLDIRVDDLFREVSPIEPEGR